MDSSDFFITPNPPKGPAPLRLVRVKAHRMQPYFFTVLSTGMWGVRVHWTGECSSPCRKAKERCPGCRLGSPRKWIGYLHCLDESGDEILLEVTRRAATMLLDSVPQGRILRGLKIAVQRTEGGKHGRLCAHCRGVAHESAKLPAPKDPLYTLLFVWGLQDGLDDPYTEKLA